MEGPTSTGIPHRKLAMWTFIGSECMLFGTLIATYMIYRGRNVVGPYPRDLVNIPFISVTTFVLLMSSLMMVLALAAVQRNDLKSTKIWLFMTPLFGLIFLGGQFYEFNHFVHEGLPLSRNLFSSTFFVLTGNTWRTCGGGRDLAGHAFRPRDRRQAGFEQQRNRRDRRALLALRRCGVDRLIHLDLSAGVNRPWKPARVVQPGGRVR